MTEFEYLQKLSVTKEEYVHSISIPVGMSENDKAIIANMGLGHSKSLMVSGGMYEHRKAYVTSLARITPMLNGKVPLKTVIYCSEGSANGYTNAFNGSLTSAVRTCDLADEFATAVIDVARIVEDRYNILNFVGQKNVHEYNVYLRDKLGEELTDEEASILRLNRGCVYEESLLMKPLLVVFDEAQDRMIHASEFEKCLIDKYLECILKWGAVTGVFLIITADSKADIYDKYHGMFDTRIAIDGDDYFYQYAYKGDVLDNVSGSFSRYYDIATEVKIKIPLLQYKEERKEK